MKNNDFLNEKQNFNSKDFLISLQGLGVNSYQELGYTLKSLCKVTQTALLMDISYPKLSERSKWDVFNILTLIRRLIPESELELMDLLNKKA